MCVFAIRSSHDLHRRARGRCTEPDQRINPVHRHAGGARVAAPGWFRLRIGEYRICYYRARVQGTDGPVTIYAVERIVPFGAFDAAAVSLPEQR